MMKARRLGILVLCVVFVAGIFAFSLHDAGHEGCEGHCLICEAVARLRTLWFMIPATCALIILCLCHNGQLPFVSRVVLFPTLVSWKIRLDD